MYCTPQVFTTSQTFSQPHVLMFKKNAWNPFICKKKKLAFLWEPGSKGLQICGDCSATIGLRACDHKRIESPKLRSASSHSLGQRLFSCGRGAQLRMYVYAPTLAFLALRRCALSRIVAAHHSHFNVRPRHFKEFSADLLVLFRWIQERSTQYQWVLYSQRRNGVPRYRICAL